LHLIHHHLLIRMQCIYVDWVGGGGWATHCELAS